jgi:hypothetical protein
MSVKVTVEQKAELKRLEKWDAFVLLREELKGNGASETDATTQALMKFVPGLVDILTCDDLMASLVGKKPKPAEVIQWVANNLSGPPDFASCPGLAAYTLLMDCQKFPPFRVDFWKNMWTKLIPARAQLVDEDENEMDGQATIDFLQKIKAIGERIESRREGVA